MCAVLDVIYGKGTSYLEMQSHTDGVELLRYQLHVAIAIFRMHASVWHGSRIYS